MSLYEDGHQLVHLTLTQPTMEGDPDVEPVHLTDFEQRYMSYAGVVAAPDEAAVSTPGEGPAAGIDRLLRSFKWLRRGNRGMARAWGESEGWCHCAAMACAPSRCAGVASWYGYSLH